MKELGDPAETFMNAIDAGIYPATMQSVYDLQHADVRLSKLVSSISYFDIYLAFLEWITANLDEPNSFLDLGCGNGLFLLAIKEIWNNSEGIGIDVNEQAIRTALKLQDSVEGEGAIDFFHADLAKPIGEDLRKRIGAPNIVFAGFFFHELMHDEQAMMRTLTNLASFLPESAVLVSLDRFPETEVQREELISLMNRVGISAQDKDVLFVGAERFPLTVFASKAAV